MTPSAQENKKIVATIIPQHEHRITPEQINKNALKVLKQLRLAGFDAYIVGGCVRDLILGHRPKDFDIVTNARPNQIKKLFRYCYLIGRRFRLAHVHFGREIIEVATFRNSQTDPNLSEEKTHQGMLLRDNIYGTINQDAFRRDFSINALYYNIEDSTVLDFANGFGDLQKKVLRILGDPETRFREDPVRIIRAIRIAGKLDFKIDSETDKAIFNFIHLLKNISSSRLFDETIKLFQTGASAKITALIFKYKLQKILFPLTYQCEEEGIHPILPLFDVLLTNTDKRFHKNKTISPFFLFAAILWFPLINRWKSLKATGLTNTLAFDRAAKELLAEQSKITTISQRIRIAIRETWTLQHRFEQRRPKHIHRIFYHPQFRAAYDLLLIRTQVNAPLQKIATWWTKFQSVDKSAQNAMINDLNKAK